MRLHPAESRVRKLAVEIPASIVFFDLLCEGDKSLCDTPFAKRRARLKALLKNVEPPLHITPATRDRKTAADWFQRFEGAGVGGRRPAASHAGWTESMERGKGLVLGAVASGARRRSRVRPHAGRSLPSHRPVSPLARRQAASCLHLRSAGSGTAARARGDLRHLSLANPATGM